MKCLVFPQGELSDLYGSLSVGGSEGGESTTSLETIMRINSFLNNSLDLHNIVPDTSSRHSIGEQGQGTPHQPHLFYRHANTYSFRSVSS
ncbi:hypothetical protein E2C01_086016 [Portunus trituberculatus]|uniref:Uncharacterized protein n=1 Tax=Portunus trituberculatus TaxID=210409 RepID=A0A5B7JDH2_PORTR|nr:hypothetical protein [Portunus trituberculatus]